jgi:hypothetical protein
MLLAAPLGGGCGGDGGGSPTGGGGSGGGGGAVLPEDKISDFEDIAAATVVNAGTPPRNGYWFSYNDASPTCVQDPINGAAYLPSSPPTAAGGPSGGMALHAKWDGCSVWGAGVGADIAQPSVDGGSYMGPKVNYDLTGAKGITFWGMTSTTADNKLRIKLNMRAETKIADGGPGATAPTFCDEATYGANKCSDAWGYAFTLPIAGNWQQITVLFSDTAKFKQEGWGAKFPWNLADVTGIQIQSQGLETSQPFDFWIDDIYIIR